MFWPRISHSPKPPELTPVERDALRYQFIRKVIEGMVKDHPAVAGIHVRPPGKKYWFDTVNDFDDAIDEAMRHDRKRI